jgi:beta-aspartyl-peptidase (threonine type)
MGKLKFEDVAVEVLSAEHALVRGGWHLTLEKESVNGLFTLVMKKLPQGWRIVHDHTSS